MTIFNPASIQTMWGTARRANVLQKPLVMLREVYVFVKQFQVDSSAGEAQVDQNPSFHRDCVVVCEDRSEDVSLAV